MIRTRTLAVVMLVGALALLANIASAQEATSTPSPLEGLRALQALLNPTEEAPDMTLFEGIEMDVTEDGGFILGDPDAPITIVDFYDFACPACQAYHPTIEQFIAEYVATGQARYEARIFPTAGGQLTEGLGNIAACAAEDDPAIYWTAYMLFYDLAYAGEYNEGAFDALVAQTGQDADALLACYEDQQHVQDNVTLGRELGVSGTPGILVRYGQGDPEFIVYQDVIYNQGGVPFEVLAAVVEEANAPGGQAAKR